MGLILSRFRSKQKSTTEVLEDLDKDIKGLSVHRHTSQQYEKSFVGYLLIISFFAYLIGAIIFYLYFLPNTWLEGVVNSLPLLLFPVVVYLVKKLLNIYFTHKNTQYDVQLRTLQEEKRRVLNQVMEKETYNTARELLQRYDPNHPSLRRDERERAQQPTRPAGAGGVRQRRPPQTPHPALQHRPAPMATPQTVPRANPRPVPLVTPARPNVTTGTGPHALGTVTMPAVTQLPPPPLQPTSSAPSVVEQYVLPPGMCAGSAPGPPNPCPILPRERSGMDKVVEYLVGDGPNNRYALICLRCHSHNGMALRDEFEYMTFRCAYCYHLNPARKRKPSLRPQPFTATLPPLATSDVGAAEGGRGSQPATPTDPTPASDSDPGRSDTSHSPTTRQPRRRQGSTDSN